MNVKYRPLEDMLMSIIHSLETDSDNVTRMRNAQELLKIVRTRLTDIRNESSYLARQSATTMNLAEQTRFDRKAIEQWSNTWAEKKGIPRIRERRNRPWQVGFNDLSGGQRFPQ